MAEKDIWTALADDWELRGNGLGDVRKHQYDCALRLPPLRPLLVRHYPGNLPAHEMGAKRLL